MTKKLFIAGSVQYSNLYNYGTFDEKLNKYNEGTQVQSIVDYMITELKLYEVEIVRTVKGMDLNASAKLANDTGCTSYYAIHTNAGGGQGVVAIKQTSIFVPKAYRDKSAIMATELTNSVESLGRHNRGTYGKRNSWGGEWYSDLRQPKMPSTILEIEFHDWDLGAKWIINNKALIGRTLARAIAKVEGLVKKVVTYQGAFPTALVKYHYGTHENIVRWQNFMTWWGIYLKPDGDFGTLTDAATRKFQSHYGLKPDGMVGIITRNFAKTVGKL